MGDSVDLVCSGDIEHKVCSFQTPSNQLRVMYDGANYPRIRKTSDNPMDCGIEVSPVAEEDNGRWKCIYNALDKNGQSVTGEGEINVVVGIPPTSVEMRMNGKVVNSDTLPMKLDDASSGEIAINCIANNTRPKPEFKWYIGETDIQVRM